MGSDGTQKEWSSQSNMERHWRKPEQSDNQSRDRKKRGRGEDGGASDWFTLISPGGLGGKQMGQGSARLGTSLFTLPQCLVWGTGMIRGSTLSFPGSSNFYLLIILLNIV